MVGSSMNLEDGATREEVEEALVHHVHAAKRTFAAVGNEAYPTPWDKAHVRINELLDLLDQYKVEVA